MTNTIDQFCITGVPAFADNYLWVMHDRATKRAIVVDPGDATPVIAFLTAHQLTLEAILITHHHGDHVGGIGTLLDFLPNSRDLPVYGPATENIPHRTHALREGDVVSTLGLQFEVWDVPGHTAGHITYHHAALKLLFSGDTIFAAGCGRILGGNAVDFSRSLARIAALPAETQIYCTHEYTISNLRFALHVEPNNHALIERAAVEHAKRACNEPTVPTTVGVERATNPFLRLDSPAILKSIDCYDPRAISGENAANGSPALVFGTLRRMKDEFK